jgi:hypothetical protein
MAAADAAAAIDAVLARRPCGSAPLKAALSKAEAAAAAISNSCAGSVAAPRTTAAAAGGGGSGGGGASQGSSISVLFSELLVSRLQCGKKRLEVERAAEALHKASLAYRSLGDLPKLETAVLNARKVCVCVEFTGPGRKGGTSRTACTAAASAQSPALSRGDTHTAPFTTQPPTRCTYVEHTGWC